MQEIKKLKLLSVANIAAFIYALFGFLASFGTLVYSLVKVVIEKETAGKLLYFIAINFGLDFLISLGAALITGICGWILGLVAAFFYNFIAKNIGGIKMEMVDAEGKVITAKVEEKKQELFKY